MRKIIAALALFAIALTGIYTALITNGYFAIVESNSMHPTLSKGDVVYIVKSNEYVPGDIILFIYNNQTYIHRIIFAENGKYRTKGDASVNLDYWQIEKKNILGKLAFKVPFLGNLWIK